MGAGDNIDNAIIGEQIDYYERRAPDYDRATRPPGDPFLVEGIHLEEALGAFEPRGSVLEIACGTGEWTRLLVKHALDVTALDASPTMLRLNKEKLSGARVDYIQADLFSWTPERTYDVVFFANWLSHVPPGMFERFWSTVGSALAPEGRVFFIDETDDAWRYEEVLSEVASDGSRPFVTRRLKDGDSFRVVKIFWDAKELQERLERLGWSITVQLAGPFYWGQGSLSVP